ncbi:hypothetical protein ABGV40_00370 [Paenibacillus amylolyticus]|uniref:hypothetical protein n=1 Tax=Paenibacillus amylolyticus TaxID=1451 RepID=UPI003241FF61
MTMIGVADAQSYSFGAWVALRQRNAPLIAVIPGFFDQPFTGLKSGDKGERFASSGHFRFLRYVVHLEHFAGNCTPIHCGWQY